MNDCERYVHSVEPLVSAQARLLSVVFNVGMLELPAGVVDGIHAGLASSFGKNHAWQYQTACETSICDHVCTSFQ